MLNEQADLHNARLFTYAVSMNHRSRRKLPPLSALRAFEAAARRGSVTQAADELHLTHGAISRHIAALEAHYGKKLFARHARGVTPTAAGAHLQAIVKDVLDRLAVGSREVFDGEKPGLHRVVVSVLPSFAIRWLLPRLPEFKATHRGVEVELRAEYDFADLRPRASAPDFAVRYGFGTWGGLYSVQMMTEWLAPVCAPEVFAKRADFHALFARLPVLHDSNEDAWTQWLSRTATRIPEDAPPALMFNDYGLALEAAAQGFGLAMGRSHIIERDLAEGRLVQPCPVRIASPRAYYLVCHARERLSESARAFWDWLLSAAESSAVPVAAKKRGASSDSTALLSARLEGK